MKLYIITNRRTDKQYVGITGGTVAKRFLQHCLQAARGRPGALYDAIREDGPEAFYVGSIGEAHTRTQLFATEVLEIQRRRTLYPNGYNMTLGGAGVKKPPRVMLLPERQARTRGRMRRHKEQPK